MVGACQLRLQCITNAGWEGQEEDKTDSQGSSTAGILFATIIAPAACRPIPLHIITFLLLRQATSEEEASDGQVSDADEPGPSTKKNKRKHKKDKPLTKMTDEQREVMIASVLLCSYLNDLPQHDNCLCDFAAECTYTSFA